MLLGANEPSSAYQFFSQTFAGRKPAPLGRLPEIRHRAWPADLSLGALPRIIDMHHWTLLRDALHGAQRDPAQARYLGLAMTSLQQNLNFVSFQHPSIPASSSPPPPGQAGAQGDF